MSRQRVRIGSTGRSKYGAIPTTVDGIRFHSAKEARRYGELKLLVKAGKIRNLELQPVFTLMAPVKTPGIWWLNTKKIGTYRGDFQYEERGTVLVEGGCASETWTLRVEDVKGVKTPVYQLKKKLVEAFHGIQIREV